jgi:multiple sugar transport system ATP-binding protein
MTYIGRTLAFGIRPEDIEDAALVAGADGSIVHLAVDDHEDMGSELLLYFDLDASPVLTQDMQSLAADRGVDELRSLEEQARKRQARIAARVGSRSRARSGEMAAVHVDMRNAHFFDLVSGEAIYGDRVPVETTVSAVGRAEGR